MYTIVKMNLIIYVLPFGINIEFMYVCMHECRARGFPGTYIYIYTCTYCTLLQHIEYIRMYTM